MIKPATILGLIVVLFCMSFSFCFAQEEKITISTYYPSPYGSYDVVNVNEIKWNLLPEDPFACTPDKRGYSYYNSTLMELRICDCVQPANTNCQWTSIVKTEEGSGFFIFNYNSDGSCKVGFGARPEDNYRGDLRFARGYDVCHYYGKCCAAIGEPSGYIGMDNCWTRRYCGPGYFWGGYRARSLNKCRAKATFVKDKDAVYNAEGVLISAAVEESCTIGTVSIIPGGSVPVGSVCLNSDGEASDDRNACHIYPATYKRMAGGASKEGWCYYACAEERVDYGYAMCYDCSKPQTVQNDPSEPR